MSVKDRKANYHFNKLTKRLRRKASQAISDFNMIAENDRIMVCLSGGADSFTLLDILIYLQQIAPINFKLIAVNLDQKQPGFPTHILPHYLKKHQIPYYIIEQDTYSIVKRIIPEGKTQCGLCSRLRRGIFYRFAAENDINKIALGHHSDDIIETLFLNMFYHGKLKAMPPKLLSDNKKHIIIRPLSYCREHEIKAYAQQKQFPIIPCTLCGNQKNLQRQTIKVMLRQWQKQYPGRVENIFSAIGNLIPSHLADITKFDFSSLKD